MLFFSPSQFQYVIILTLILNLLEGVNMTCSIVGAAAPGDPPLKANTTIEPWIEGEIDVCPYLSGKEVCCNSGQIKQMRDNFRDIDMLFGADCPICGVNMKILWCEFTCSPTQADFIAPDNIIQVQKSGRWYDALHLDFHLNTSSACKLFNSCKKVPEVAQISNSAPGFLQFQGENSVTRGHVVIDFKYNKEEGYKRVNLPVGDCNTQFLDNTYLNYTEITPCPCSYCEKSCTKAANVVVYPGYFYGFNWKLVLVVYIIVISLSVIIYFIKSCTAKRKGKKEQGEDISAELEVEGSDQHESLLSE